VADLQPNSQSILYFGNDWSAENRTSSHHIAEQLSKNHRMIYVECPGLRAPSMSGRDLRKIFSKLFKLIQGPKKVHDNLYVYSLFQLPFHGSGIVSKLNPIIVRLQMLRLIITKKFRDPLLWFVIPHLGYLPNLMPKSYSVYYCIDKYAALPGVNFDAISKLDNLLTKSAGTVFVASETLLGEKKQLNPNVFLSPHGVDYEHFSSAGSGNLPVPIDIREINSPIVGFFGLLEAWIDLSIFVAVAEAFPEISIVIIGHAAVDVSELEKFDNIYLLGKKNFKDLPTYAAKFDVGILPYHLTEQVINSNPLKLREYLAIGCPVVSVKFPQAEKFADYINIASTKDEFVEMVGIAVKDGKEKGKEGRQNSVKKYTWESRAKNALKQVLEHKAVN
jgi:glycosyltransferase involved in cell wall biosynthesis